jgi:hypothetical protein
MSRKRMLLAVGMLLLGLGAVRAADGRSQGQAGAVEAGFLEKLARLRIISSSHQDIAWMNSPDACREYRDLQCITPALKMMAENKDYCFVMENMYNLMEYLEPTRTARPTSSA